MVKFNGTDQSSCYQNSVLNYVNTADYISLVETLNFFLTVLFTWVIINQ